MGRSIEITVGSRIFPSKKKAKAFYRGIRDLYSDGLRLNEYHHQALLELVAIHHDAKSKIGSGIEYFTVETETTFRRTRHFQIYRNDGSSTDVSFTVPLDGPNERRDKLESLRRAIHGQIVAFKKREFANSQSLRCPVIGCAVEQQNSHVDHVQPQTFLKLVKCWLLAEKIKFTDIEVSTPVDNQIVTTMSDPNQLRAWQGYHLKNAELRILSSRANLSLGSGR